MPFRAILKYVLLVAIIAATAGGYMLSRLDLNSLRPPIADKVKEVTGRDFEIAGALKLDIGISPAIVLEDVRLQNAMFGTRAEMIKARKLEAHFALLPLLLGRIEINRLALVGPDILLETDEQGRSNWDFSRDDEPAYAPRPASVENAALELPKLGAVSITNGLFTYRNGMTGRTTKIAVTRFTGRSSSRDAPLVIDLTAAYDGTPFRVAGRLGAFVTLGGPGAFPVDLTAVVSDVQFALKGTVNRPLAPTSSKLSVIINSKNLNALEPLLKVTLPDRPMIFAGQVATEHGVLTVTDIKAKLGDSDLQGRLRLAPGKERRLLTASLNSRHLDLADVLIGDATPDNGAKAAGNGQERVEDERLFSDAPLLPYDLLELVDAAVDAKMDRLVMGRVTLSQAALTAKLKDGQLHIDPLSAVLAEGQMNGSVVLDSADRGRAKVSLQLLGVDMRLLSQSFDSSNIISGKMDVSAILAGRGASLRALMASLDGKTSIVMGKGQLKSSYADLMGADLFRFAAAGETTQVNCLVGRFDIAKGLIASHDILFDTGQMTIKGEGEISLSDEKFDLTFTTSPKESVVDLSAPWRVSGPLQRPKVDGDIASTLFSAINPFDGTDAENLCIAALAAPRPAGQPAAKPVVRPAKQDADAFRDAPEKLDAGLMTVSRSEDKPARPPEDSRQPALRRATQWEVRPTGAGHGVYGDGRVLRTPAGRPVVVASRPLAEAIVGELRAQAALKALDITGLPNLRLVATAIDQVAAARESHIDAIAAYGETELLCYRAEHPADLVARQHEAWQPLLDWAARRFQAPLVTTAGVMPQDQPADSLTALRAAIAGYDDLMLAALAFAVQTSGSLVVGLAMAEGRLDAARAFALAELDESYQIERWGEEAEAAQRRATRRDDLAQVARFMALVREA